MEESKLKVKCQICDREWMWGIKNDKNANSFICPECLLHINETEPVFILKVIMPNKNSIDYVTQYKAAIFGDKQNIQVKLLIDGLAEFIQTDVIDGITQEKNQ